jgi:hypothetical protein
MKTEKYFNNTKLVQQTAQLDTAEEERWERQCCLEERFDRHCSAQTHIYKKTKLKHVFTVVVGPL